ncbi:response regulator transcription factor [Serratia marcescens]|nr:response regulator transcription factor [Serratia marcescens]
MTQAVTICILERNSFFSQGLEALLLSYFTQRDIQVRFLPWRRSMEATLLFVNNNRLRFCRQRQADTRQQVIVIRNSSCSTGREPLCLSEQGVIDRRVSIKTLMHVLEQVLAETVVATPVRRCSRCAPTLTPRELQVLAFMQKGYIGQQVARLMNLSPKTVSGHKCSAMAKLGFNRNFELYQWLNKNGLSHETKNY